jgi:hypothetical protein
MTSYLNINDNWAALAAAREARQALSDATEATRAGLIGDARVAVAVAGRHLASMEALLAEQQEHQHRLAASGQDGADVSIKER